MTEYNIIYNIIYYEILYIIQDNIHINNIYYYTLMKK